MTPFERLHPALQYHVVNSLGWSSLRPAQEMAIEPILAGRDLMLLAPTAGGKTEAAIIPLLSRMLSQPWQGLSLLYVCPIKALLNNLLPRLSRYGELIGRRVQIWHGDIRPGARKRILMDPPDLLLTTPESLEAMLISQTVDHQRLFADLQAIVIDEMHAFAGDDRGWHLQAVLARLDRLAGRRLQRVGLSATVGNPDRLAVWLSGPSAEPARVVQATATMPVAPELTIDHVGSLHNAAIVISQMHKGEKRLVFCDSRAGAEELAASLRDLHVQTHVSHSSLGLDERQRAETAFAEGSDCVIVATSTLELGLDVGDLDRVIQIDAPGTVASFLQRLGRTGRRLGTSRNCLFLTTTPDTFLQAAALVRLWATGFVEPIEPPATPWQLLGQQILALLLQEHAIPADRLSSWFVAASPFVEEWPTVGAEIVRFLRESDVLHEDGALLSLGVEAERRYGFRHFMELVTAFTSPPLFVVRHGRLELGQVHHSSFQMIDGRPPVLLLGGRGWVVTSLDWDARVAWVEPTAEHGRSRWQGTSRALHAPLCRSIRCLLAEGDMGIYLSERGRRMMAELQDEYRWVRPDETALLRDGSGRCQWWTFAGALANRILAAALSRQGLTVRRVDNMAIGLDDVPHDAFLEALAGLAGDVLEPTVDERALSNWKFADLLPHDLAVRVAANRQADAESVSQALREPIRSVFGLANG